MRISTARFAIGLAVLSLGACGRTVMDEPWAGQPDDGAGDEGGVTNAGGAGAAHSGGAGAQANPGAGAVAGSKTGGTVATGGVSAIGGMLVGGTSASGGAPQQGGAVTGGVRASGGTGGTSAAGGRGGSSGGATTGGASGGRGGSIVGGATTGGAGGGGGAVSSGGASSCPTLASNEELIDDLNDGDRFIAKTGGRVGAWKVANDGSPGGTMSPDPKATFVPTNTGDPCWKYAVYVKASGFTSSQGSSFSFGLGAPYDASKYTGISFWAKSDAGSPYVRVQFPDKDTDLDAGLCTMSGPTATMCYDHYGYRFQFKPGWNKYTIPFKSLTQDGWGRKGAAFDPSTLFEVIFQFPANASYAIWMDNVAFTM